MKKITLTLAFTILLVFLGTVVLATDAFVTPVISTSVTELSEGGNLSVTLRADQISFEAGINLVSFKVKYDTEIFEQIDSTSFDAQNDWQVKYEPLSNEVTLSMTNNLQSEAGDIVKIDFKAKSGTTGKTTTITLTDMVFGDGYSTNFEAQDTSTSTITIDEAKEIPPIVIDPDPTPEPDPTPDPTPEPEPKPKEPSKEIPDEIPETGLADNLVYIIAGLFIVALGFFISYKNLEKKNIRYVNVE